MGRSGRSANPLQPLRVWFGGHHQVVCATCGPVEDPAEVQARPGPGMPAERIEFMEKLRAGRARKFLRRYWQSGLATDGVKA